MNCVQILKTVSTIILWVLWKYRCNRLYDGVDIHLSDVLFELWENLLAVVRGQYDNMQGSPDTVNKKRKKVRLFTMVAQEPQWQYRLPWTL